MARSRSLTLIHVDAQDNLTSEDVPHHTKCVFMTVPRQGIGVMMGLCHVGLCVPSCQYSAEFRVKFHATLRVVWQRQWRICVMLHAGVLTSVCANFVMPQSSCAAGPPTCHAYVMLFQLLIRCCFATGSMSR
ncbi:hypothetical protein HAX54_005354, partial [Datura stramonium]|nr:hypothetical protein [Datura stramonium]